MNPDGVDIYMAIPRRHYDGSSWRHQLETFSVLLALCVGIHRSTLKLITSWFIFFMIYVYVIASLSYINNKKHVFVKLYSQNISLMADVRNSRGYYFKIGKHFRCSSRSHCSSDTCRQMSFRHNPTCRAYRTLKEEYIHTLKPRQYVYYTTSFPRLKIIVIWLKFDGSFMMTSSNGNIFRVTGRCAGNSPVPGEFPAQRPVTRSFGVFFDLRLNKRLRKQS